MYNSDGDIMKRILTFTIILSALFVFSSCGKTTDIILDNSEKSRYIDFYTEDDYVYIECELNIYAEKATEVTISAIDSDNVETGMLKNKNLIGIDKTDKDEIFSLKAGENTVSVLFRGAYTGAFIIAEREIPRFIKIEEK